MVLVAPEETCNTCGVPMSAAAKPRMLHRHHHEDIFVTIREIQAALQDQETRLRILEAWARDAR